MATNNLWLLRERYSWTLTHCFHRAKVEADQGNHLLMISRTVLADKEETGNTLRALETVSNEIGNNANSHLELAQKIEADVVQPLRNFSENYINQVRECQQRLERLSESRDIYASRIVEVSYIHIILQRLVKSDDLRLYVLF